MELVGKRIKAVRTMTKAELKFFLWSPGMGDIPTVVELEDGTRMIPMRDAEGNGPGVVTVMDPDGAWDILNPARGNR